MKTKTDGSTILLTERDIIAKKEYDAMYPKYEYISPKKRKAKFLSSLKGWKEKDLMKLQSKQLTKLIYTQ